MEIGIWSVLGMGLLIGLRHSLDADHVIAVSTIATRTGNPFKAGITGIFWGIGHTLTIVIVGCIFLLFGLGISEQFEYYFEAIVGIVLIYLGIRTLLDAKSQHAATTTSLNKFHIRSFLVGLIHGLAGSAALTILMVSQVNHSGQGILFLLLFGIGSVVGMFIIATLISIPMRTAKTRTVQNFILYVVGTVSIGFGIAFFFLN
ncbi:urease accessory protein UreH [Alkalihalobacillus sp. BA299]|uniref:urease accessory protein UreH n=1 Tax=Alkalihalobacillus sp. BA299 TaxID=2815938 RepID=UPI001ADA4583|nr:urease accessory protein UreH [Alkalihalobacillus sp. BA299]